MMIEYDSMNVLKRSIILLLFVLLVFSPSALAQGKKDKKPLPAEGDTVAFNSLSKLPAIIKQVPPEYPAEPRAKGFEATVTMRVLIGKDGTPLKARVILARNNNPSKLPKKEEERLLKLFHQPSIAAVLKWRFGPPYGPDKQPANTWLNVPFNYKITK